MDPVASPNPLKAYLRVQVRADSDMRVILERTASDIAARIRTLRPGVGSDIRAAQLKAVLGNIDQILRTMYGTNGVQRVIREHAANAAQMAVDVATAFDRVLTRSLTEKAATALLDGMEQAALEGIRSDAVRKARELSSRVFASRDLANGLVQHAIRSGLIQGLSSRELALTVRAMVLPSTPGGVSFAAMRLARTEINNAFHEAQIQAGQRPWVTGMKWNLSGSHPRPDQCNAYAGGDHEGLGSGVYGTSNVPSKPHPQCLCYLTPVTVSRVKFIEDFMAGKYN